MKILLNLLAGVALLVWGTHIVRTGILRIYGGDLRRLLRESVSNRFAAFSAGLGITALIQSSNATALMVASFAGQGLIATAPALAVMLGADVGTALMTLVFSFDLSWLSPLLIFVGVVLFMRRESTEHRPLRPDPDRARAHHLRAAADRPRRATADAGGRRQGHLRLADRRHPARHAGRRTVHDAFLFEPRSGAADGRLGDVESHLPARRDGPGAGRQPRQRPAGDAQYDALAAGSAPRRRSAT